MQAASITVVGSINLDLAIKLQRLPDPGETVSASSLQRFAGGKVRAHPPSSFYRRSTVAQPVRRTRPEALQTAHYLDRCMSARRCRSSARLCMLSLIKVRCKCDCSDELQGANQAAAAAMLGCDTTMVGQVGDDAGADFMLDAITSAGVRTQDTVSRIPDVATGTAVVLLQPGGENSIVIVGGANTADGTWACDGAARSAVENTGMVLLQRELPEAVNTRFARAAREAGVPVLLDAGGEEGKLSPELLECLTLLSPNETELARMTGMATGTRAEVAAAARELRKQGGCDVLVKLGAKGSVLFAGAGSAPHWACASTSLQTRCARCGQTPPSLARALPCRPEYVAACPASDLPVLTGAQSALLYSHANQLATGAHVIPTLRRWRACRAGRNACRRSRGHDGRRRLLHRGLCGVAARGALTS